MANKFYRAGGSFNDSIDLSLLKSNGRQLNLRMDSFRTKSFTELTLESTSKSLPTPPEIYETEEALEAVQILQRLYRGHLARRQCFNGSEVDWEQMTPQSAWNKLRVFDLSVSRRSFFLLRLLSERISSLPFFLGMDKTALSFLLRRCDRRRLEADEHLFIEGNKSEFVFVVLSGEINRYGAGHKTIPTGSTIVGGCIGEEGLFDKRPWTAKSAVESVVLSVPGEEYYQMIKGTSKYYGTGGLHDRISFLRTLPEFGHLTFANISKLAQAAEIEDVKPNARIISVEGQEVVVVWKGAVVYTSERVEPESEQHIRLTNITLQQISVDPSGALAVSKPNFLFHPPAATRVMKVASVGPGCILRNAPAPFIISAGRIGAVLIKIPPAMYEKYSTVNPDAEDSTTEFAMERVQTSAVLSETKAALIARAAQMVESPKGSSKRAFPPPSPNSRFSPRGSSRFSLLSVDTPVGVLSPTEKLLLATQRPRTTASVTRRRDGGLGTSSEGEQNHAQSQIDLTQREESMFHEAMGLLSAIRPVATNAMSPLASVLTASHARPTPAGGEEKDVEEVEDGYLRNDESGKFVDLQMLFKPTGIISDVKPPAPPPAEVAAVPMSSTRIKLIHLWEEQAEKRCAALEEERLEEERRHPRYKNINKSVEYARVVAEGERERAVLARKALWGPVRVDGDDHHDFSEQNMSPRKKNGPARAPSFSTPSISHQGSSSVAASPILSRSPLTNLSRSTNIPRSPRTNFISQRSALACREDWLTPKAAAIEMSPRKRQTGMFRTNSHILDMPRYFRGRSVIKYDRFRQRFDVEAKKEDPGSLMDQLQLTEVQKQMNFFMQQRYQKEHNEIVDEEYTEFGATEVRRMEVRTVRDLAIEAGGQQRPDNLDACLIGGARLDNIIPLLEAQNSIRQRKNERFTILERGQLLTHHEMAFDAPNDVQQFMATPLRADDTATLEEAFFAVYLDKDRDDVTTLHEKLLPHIAPTHNRHHGFVRVDNLRELWLTHPDSAQAKLIVKNICSLGTSEPNSIWLLDLPDDVIAFASFTSQTEAERAAAAGASEIFHAGLAFTIRLSSRKEFEQTLTRTRETSKTMRRQLLSSPSQTTDHPSHKLDPALQTANEASASPPHQLKLQWSRIRERVQQESKPKGGDKPSLSIPKRKLSVKK